MVVYPEMLYRIDCALQLQGKAATQANTQNPHSSAWQEENVLGRLQS